MNAKHIILSLMALILIAALSALTACAPEVPSITKESYIGTWKVVKLEKKGEVLESDDVAKLDEVGLQLLFTANEDDTASLNLFGEMSDGTWKMLDGQDGKAELQLDDETIEMSIDTEGHLSFTQESADATLTFEKVVDEEELADIEAVEENGNEEASEEAQQQPENENQNTETAIEVGDDDQDEKTQERENKKKSAPQTYDL